MNARAYYNEIDPCAADWLRNLIGAGLIAAGDVDQRSIVDVRPDDLAGYTQCHFFAGIGGWSYALRLAGWPDNRAVWTGSCPCQPFSLIGKQAGFDDSRHLWPEFKRLIGKCKPPSVFGEQVTSASEWLRLVRSDLEAMGYAVGAMPVEAASAAADHYRDRYWFVGDRIGAGLERHAGHVDLRAERSSAIGSATAPGVQFDWYLGADGKRRRAQSGIRLRADAVPGRVAQLRAFGNAIVPSCAAEFIAAYIEAITERAP